MNRLVPGIPALLLAGCLFNSETSGTRFDVEFYGEINTVYAYDANGSRGAALGLGAGVVKGRDAWISMDSEQEALVFWPASPDKPYHLLSITQDSTFVMTMEVQANPTFPTVSLDTLRAYAGAPCTFTGIHGFLRDTASESIDFTVPVVLGETHLTQAGNTLRFDLLIDSAASRAADARVDFSEDEAFYGTMRVSCP